MLGFVNPIGMNEVIAGNLCNVCLGSDDLGVEELACWA